MSHHELNNFLAKPLSPSMHQHLNGPRLFPLFAEALSVGNRSVQGCAPEKCSG